MIETHNIIAYNRHKYDISLIYNHINITAEEIIDKMKNVHISLDFKTKYEKRKQKKFWYLKIIRKNAVNLFIYIYIYIYLFIYIYKVDVYQNYSSFWF